MKKSEATKQRIMASALKLIQKKGFAATSVREIVADAGCAKGTFYLYFETKMELLKELSIQIFASFSQMFQAELSEVEDDPFAQIDRVFDRLYAIMKESEGHLRLLHTGEILNFVLEQNFGRPYLEAIIGQLATFLLAGMDSGYFRPVNPQLYARILFGIGHELLESALLHEYPDTTETMKKELAVIIRCILAQPKE
ncbi:MAG TPA: TetR/AcrR family transcriptional regulator [Firmicutes bacterium]|nr:TetR/AcrR family transcriptional regulator [Bacillota bacterium]